jgi:hypothetical protein
MNPFTNHTLDTINSPTLVNSHKIYKATHNSVSTFLEYFIQEEKDSEKPNQDLLRAMLLFATSGLDSMGKQIIKDCLPKICDIDEGSQLQFKTFLQRKLTKVDSEIDIKYLADILSQQAPYDRLKDDWIEKLTQNSLQSVEELNTVIAALNLNGNKILNNINYIKQILQARNEITHEMDIQIDSTTPITQRERDKDTMISYTEEIVKISKSLLQEVDNKLIELHKDANSTQKHLKEI